MVRLSILALLFVLEGPTASAFQAATWGRQALGATTPSSLSASASETSGRRRRATTMMARGRGKKARELAKLEALNGPPPLELSRPMELEKLSRGRTLSITATEEEMAKLSERFNLAGISKFEASLAVAAGSVKRGLSLKGTLEAELRQVCVVSGEEFTAPLEAEFECTLIEGDETAVAARLSGKRTRCPALGVAPPCLLLPTNTPRHRVIHPPHMCQHVI